MSGEKHLLASIAVAVALLDTKDFMTSVVTFSSGAKVVKHLLQHESVDNTVIKFLKIRPRGFTNIGKGLTVGLNDIKHLPKKLGLLASDGRTTEGGDPAEISARFDSLVVLHLHGPGSDLSASRAIASRGHGFCLEVERFGQLPSKMYEALRWLGRR
jgi:hypothetical protein